MSTILDSVSQAFSIRTGCYVLMMQHSAQYDLINEDKNSKHKQTEEQKQTSHTHTHTHTPVRPRRIPCNRTLFYLNIVLLHHFTSKISERQRPKSVSELAVVSSTENLPFTFLRSKGTFDVGRSICWLKKQNYQICLFFRSNTHTRTPPPSHHTHTLEHPHTHTHTPHTHTHM